MRLTIVFCAVALLGQQPAVPEPSGSIRGKVVDAGSGAALKKATVSIGTVHTHGKPPRRESTEADANGNFELTGLPAGVYALWAEHGQFPRARRPTVVTLLDDEQKKGVEIKLSPGGAITGRVTGEDGQPLAGCSVRAHSTRSGMEIRGARTDDRGEYRIFNLAPGRYYVQVWANRRIPQARSLAPKESIPERTLSYTTAYYPGARDRAGATAVTVESRVELQGVNIRMKPEETAIVAGRIEPPPDAGPGFRETTLRLLPRNEEGETPGDAYTRQGKFRFENVVPGSYWIVARDFNMEPIYTRVPLDVGQQSIAGLVVPLRKAWRMPVTLEYEGARPNLWLMESGRRESFLEPYLQLRDDQVRIENMRPGTWTIQTSTGYVTSIHLGDRSVDGDTIEVREGEHGPLRIVVSNRTGKLSGNLELTGEGLPQILVSGKERRFFRQVYVMPSGQFEIELPPGEYLALAAYDAPYLGSSGYGKVFDRFGVPVSVKAGETVLKDFKVLRFDEIEHEL